MESKEKVFADTKEVIAEAVEQLMELGVFKTEIEIELQSHIRECVRKED